MNQVSYLYQAGVGVLVYCLLSRWYIWPFLQRQTRKSALILLLTPSLFRSVGATNLADTAVQNPVPAALGWTIATGDFICLALALLGIIALRSFPRIAIPLVWFVAIFGAIEYLIVGVWCAAERTYDHLGGHWYVGCYYVPMLGLLQVLVLMTLAKRDWPGDLNPSVSKASAPGPNHAGVAT
jgi:hypothetical protein